MTPLDSYQDALIDISRAQRLILESPYERRLRVLTDAGLTEDEIDAALTEEANEERQVA